LESGSGGGVVVVVVVVVVEWQDGNLSDVLVWPD
jgi:hypothetical protein